MDSSVFFHPDGERGAVRADREARAKQVCRTCPVIQQCRHHALSVREPYGVWGGLSETERNVLVMAGRILRAALPASTMQPVERP
jgi:WhiB family transcriptional regulator, redox-sensing transcriptional regulator